jgi:two-component system, NtrC family, sensor kinase
MKTLSLTLFLVLICSVGFAQNKTEIDNLISQLPTLPNDTNKVWAFEKIASFYYQNNLFIGQEYVDRGLELTRKLEFKRGEIMLLLRQGQIHQAKSDFVNGYKYFSEALKIAEKMQYSREKRRMLGQITSIYRNLGDYEKALEVHREVLKISKEINFDISNAYRGMGETYGEANMLDSALHYTLKGYEIVQKEANANPINFLFQLGVIYRRLGNYKQAMFYNQKGIKLSLKNQNEGYLNRVYDELAEYYQQLGKMDSCIYYKEKSLKFAQKTGFIASINKNSRFLASYFDTINPSIALKYYRLDASTRDSVYNQSRFVQFQKVNLREQQTQQEKLASEEKRNNILWRNILIFGLSFISIFAIVLYRNNRKKQQTNALLQEKNEEIQTTLSQLKATQAQLIQSEKLASLGELTAGIAHEIQNPLNFVNNFSELSVDLLEELKSPLTPDGGILDGEKIDMELLVDITQNLEKINHHGKRASSIVKGMLEHSRASTGAKELTDINALADEYLRLAYHGLRAKDSSFNSDFKTDFDENLPKIEVIPQDIGRVLLNLYNNAFYAVHQRALNVGEVEPLNLPDVKTYTPSVLVSTKHVDNQIIISVKDNGSGIPDNIKAKIFHPFFTTKPTGEGTGLGLSLAYDIVTKGHGGSLSVQSDTYGSNFIFTLPKTS